MDFFKNPHDNEIKPIEERHIELKSNKCYNELNRLLFSSKCIYLYIILIIASIMVFFYSLLAHFLKLSKFKIFLFLFFKEFIIFVIFDEISESFLKYL